MNRIIVFAKAPAPGRVKTRLCPPLSPKQAAALYAAFVKDTLEAAGKTGEAEVTVAYDPGDAPPRLDWLGLPTPPRVFLQQGGTLGERLAHAFDHAFSDGAAKVVVIGSDSPHLEPGTLRTAFQLLNQKDVALGPAEDGGYYLVGLRQPNASIFKGILWSSASVFSETAMRIKAAGLSLGLLPPLTDVDTAADFARLRQQLKVSASPPCSATRQALKDLLLAALFLFLPLTAAAAETLSLLPSSPELDSEGLPKGWEPLTFKKIDRHTRYEWTAPEHAVHAVSSSAASGLIYRLDLDPARFPVLRWRWLVPQAMRKGDELSKAGDDYAARVYVTFRYDPSRAGAGMRFKYGIAKKLYGEYPPHSGINYIWANRLPKGGSTPNPYTDRVMMLAVRSGDADAGKWLSEEHNVLDDYRRLFKEDPPRLAGIAVMTDTDNTGSQAEAWYADIELSSAP